MISEDKIKEIREKADIVDIISDYINVEQKGKNFFAICPFHDDHNPSLSVSKEKQIFNCFTCQTGGNVFSFVMEYENVSFPEAVKIVGDRIGINVDYTKKDNYKATSPLNTIMEISKKYYVNNLNTEKGISAKKYLSARGINEDTINYFEIGLASNERDSLTQFLDKKKYSLTDVELVGLINKSGPDLYDSFRNRIMIPIQNIMGETVAFTGRTYMGEGLAKYVNSKETPIFKKGQTLFNYHRVKTTLKKEKEVILVEGNMDVIKMTSVNIKNVIALMGTAITNEQISALKRLNSVIYLLLDNDEAGKTATINIGDQLTKNNINIKVVLIKDAKDPDEFINKYGKDELQKHIKDAIDYIDYKILILKEKHDISKISELTTFVKELIKTIRYLEPLEQDLIINKISKEYNLDEELIKKQLPKQEIKKAIINIKPELKINKYKELANTILYYLANDKGYARIYKNEVNLFKEKDERELLSEIYYYQKNKEEINLADFLSYISENKKLHNMMIEIINQNIERELNNNDFLMYIDSIKNIFKKEEINKVLKQIQEEVNQDNKIKLINKLTELKKEG